MEMKQTDVFRKWERKLKDSKVRALIAARLYRLANGLAGDVSSVGDGVNELRIHYGAGYRIYFRQSGYRRHTALWWRQGHADARHRYGKALGEAMERLK